MRFGIQAVSINNVTFPGNTGWSFNPGRETESGSLDGVQYETMQHEVALKPTADITTRSLKAVMVAFNSSTDLPMLTLDGAAGLRLVAGKAASGLPGYASGSVHVQRTALRGLVYVSGVRWSKGGKAELSLKAMIKGNGDGLTPSVTESLVALPAQPTTDFGFTLSSLTLSGSAIPTPDSVEISIEPNFEHEFLAGLPQPSDIVGAGAKKELSITLKAEIGDCDLGSGSGTVVAVFTRYANGGGFSTDTVTFTLNTNWIAEEGLGGQSGSSASRSLLCRTRYNGITKPLTWATA